MNSSPVSKRPNCSQMTWIPRRSAAVGTFPGRLPISYRWLGRRPNWVAGTSLQEEDLRLIPWESGSGRESVALGGRQTPIVLARGCRAVLSVITIPTARRRIQAAVKANPTRGFVKSLIVIEGVSPPRFGSCHTVSCNTTKQARRPTTGIISDP